MSPKKSKRSQAAQQLIENLLDETPSSKDSSRAPKTPEENELRMFDQTGSFGPIEVEADENQPIVFENNESEDGRLRLEEDPHKAKTVVQKTARASKDDKPPFEGTSPVVTQASHRSKIVRPATVKVQEEAATIRDSDANGGVDFGAMSSHESLVAPDVHEENTVRVQPKTLIADPEPRSEVIPITRGIDRGGATEIRSGVKIPPSPKGVPGTAPYASVEASLKQSESLRIAQNRITDLERELERVRRDNEALSTAGDTLRRRADELTSKAESLEIQAREANLRLEEEKKILRGQIQAKERESAEMRARVEEIETRLESNFKKIRVRERELEHRLEIVKMESATLVSTKDKMLLDLKRQIDQLHQESDSAKSRSQELFGQYKEKQETIRRVVRALRIALTILEGDDETVAPIKKAE